MSSFVLGSTRVTDVTRWLNAPQRSEKYESKCANMPARSGEDCTDNVQKRIRLFAERKGGREVLTQSTTFT